MKVVIHVRPRVSQLVRMPTGRGPEPGEQAAGLAPASQFPQAYTQQSCCVHSPLVCILPALICLCAGWSPAGTAGRRMSGTRFWMRLGANGNSAGRLLVVRLSRIRWPQALSGNYEWCPRNPGDGRPPRARSRSRRGGRTSSWTPPEAPPPSPGRAGSKAPSSS